MKLKLKSRLCVALAAVIIFGFAIWSILKPDNAFSASERRALAQMPAINTAALLSGRFMNEFETYTLDQFPLRDTLRSIKALNTYYVLGQGDNNGIYIVNGSASKLDATLNAAGIERAAERFGYVYQNHLEPNGMNVYLSVIPDKNHFIAAQSGRPCIEHYELAAMLADQMDYAQSIDIVPTLDIGDYYNTDLHWRQERILDTAQALCAAMGVELGGEYTAQKAADDFYGVYYGQSALPLKADELYYMQSDALDALTVFDYESGDYISVYDMQAVTGRDPYEMFLYGSKSIITIENPQCTNGRALLMFRDSFSSSLAPLMAEGFEKITLVDIRYIHPAALGNIIDFSQYSDALFIYGSSVINNSETLK